MSILGKVLIGLNLLALLGFGALGFLTYQKRTAWAHAVMTYELALNGLPVDDKDTDLNAKPKSQNLTAKAIKEVGGDPNQKTQMAAFKDFETKLKQKIDAEDSLQYPDPKDAKNLKKATVDQKRALVLMRLAVTLDDRQNLFDVWNYENDPERAKLLPEKEQKRIEAIKAALPSRIDAIFSESQLVGAAQPAVEGAETAPLGSKPMPELEREHKRQAIAHVLVTLHDVFPEETDKADPFERSSYKRVLAICGARATANALAKQAKQLEQMVAKLSELIDQERLIFADAHQLLLYQVLDKYAEAGRHQKSLDEATEQAKAQTTRRDDQKKAFDKATEDLKVVQADTAKELTRVDWLQQELYKARLRLRDANRINQDLEAQIRQLENKIGPTRPSKPPVSDIP